MKRSIIFIIVFLLSIAIAQPFIFAAKLSDEDVAKKKEGWYPTGLPLLNFDSDNGFGYGLRAYLYNNGARDEEYFAYAPYKMQLYAQFYQTTNGYQYHEVNLDMPYIMGTKFRVITSVAYDKKINANFFGIGADSAKEKLTLYDGSTYHKFDTYKDYMDYYDDNKQFTKYYNYQYTKPSYFLNVYRDLTQNLKMLVGFEVKKVTIDTWDGKKFDSNVQGPTLLEQLKPEGYKGGWSNFARLGVYYDTRDYEPDPKSGYFIDYAFEVSQGWLGSDYDFIRNSVQLQYYVPILSSLTLALRAGYTDTNMNAPFFEMGYFGFSLNRRTGNGSNRTIHGYKEQRFVAPTMTVANTELRWKFGEANPWNQNFQFKITAFYDVGNVYDKAGDPFSEPRFGDYKQSYGGGLVIAWNMATIIHFYYGMSKEDTSISINFNHTF
ncbi:MAG: Omp85 family outer membrane protein [Spirochaetota bacterium]